MGVPPQKGQSEGVEVCRRTIKNEQQVKSKEAYFSGIQPAGVGYKKNNCSKPTSIKGMVLGYPEGQPNRKVQGSLLPRGRTS